MVLAALAFGLLVAMVGTLFMVPLSYTMLIRLQGRLRQRVVRRRIAPVPVPSDPVAARGGGRR